MQLLRLYVALKIVSLAPVWATKRTTTAGLANGVSLFNRTSPSLNSDDYGSGLGPAHAPFLGLSLPASPRPDRLEDTNGYGSARDPAQGGGGGDKDGNEEHVVDIVLFGHGDEDCGGQIVEDCSEQRKVPANDALFGRVPNLEHRAPFFLSSSVSF